MPSKVTAKARKSVTAKKGLVICHIGDGKGKTTAAMGLAVRASGAGLNVYILQFVKAGRTEGGWPLGEINFFQQATGGAKIGRVTVEQVGLGFVGILGDRKERQEHVRQAVEGLARARQLVVKNDYQLIILDEILSAVELSLLSENDVLELLALKHPDVHVVITGHKRHKRIIAASDLVTEMKLIKHPYYEGVLAQKGIDF